MATATLTLGADFFDALAEAIARRALAGAEMIAGPPGGNPVPPPAQADPWDSGPEPPAPAPPPPPPAASQTTTIQTPKGPQTWTVNRADAPACECGVPAAYVQGSTNGKQWKHWRCSKGLSQDTWRGKCNFSQWA